MEEEKVKEFEEELRRKYTMKKLKLRTNGRKIKAEGTERM
jgi:hypothetical protein